MLAAIVTAFAAPVGVALLAALVTRVWQDRAWRIQQRQDGAVRDYEAIHELWQSLDRNTSNRLYASRRLLSALQPKANIDIATALAEYSLSVKKWNEDLFSIYNRTTLLLGWSYTKRIEDELHYPLARLGTEISKLRHERDREVSWDQIRSTGKMALKIQISFSNISKSILKIVEIKRDHISNGIRLRYQVNDLRSFSNLQLFKLFFVNSVKKVNLTRSL